MTPVNLNSVIDCELHINGVNHGAIKSISVTQDYDELYSMTGYVKKIYTGETYTTLSLEYYDVCVKQFIGKKYSVDGKERWIFHVERKDMYSATWTGMNKISMGDLGKLKDEVEEARAKFDELEDMLHKYVIEKFKYAGIVGGDYEISASGIKIYNQWYDEIDETGGRYGMMDVLPGLTEEKDCPTKCGRRSSLYQLIQHLNDKHEWTREKIADWLETLDVDLTFPIGEENDKD